MEALVSVMKDEFIHGQIPKMVPESYSVFLQNINNYFQCFLAYDYNSS